MTELGEEADSPEGCTAIQKALDRLERWAGRNLVKTNMMKCKILHMVRNNCQHKDIVGAILLERCSAERGVEVLMDIKLNMSQ